MFENDSTTATVARSAEFDSFRTNVRRRALLAQRSMGWDAESLNRTLITLGLEPTDAYTVRINVVAKHTYTEELTSVNNREATMERLAAITNESIVHSLPYTKWEITERAEPELIRAGSDATPDPVALGNDLDAYKKLVRSVGIKVAKERSWCDSGTNEYLEALGLAPIQRFRVPVTVNVRQVMRHEEVEAESLDEAYRLVAERQLTLDQVRSQLGSGVQEVLDVVPVDVNSLRVGDPDPQEAYSRHCDTYETVDGSARRCHREQNHGGQHLSVRNGLVTAVWPATEVPVPA